MPDSSTAIPNALVGAEFVDPVHPLRHLGLGALTRSPTPLPHGDEQEQDAERELYPTNPGGRLAVLARVASAGREQRDRADEPEAQDPADEEPRPIGPRVGGAEHEHDGDDRHRAQRHADAERGYLSDGLSHDRRPR
jgi:hypothetical protein